MGRAIARRLAEAGARVAINDRQGRAVDDVVAGLRKQGVDAMSVPGDVTLTDDVRQIIAAVRHQVGALDILANNAGVLRPTRTEFISDEEWALVPDTKLKGSSFVVVKASPSCRSRRAHSRGAGRVSDTIEQPMSRAHRSISMAATSLSDTRLRKHSVGN